MKSYQEFKELVKQYHKSFTKCNVTADKLLTLQNHYTIQETYTEKKNGKIVEKKTENVTAEYYGNIISGHGFFKDRITKGYTAAGYIAVRFYAKNPWSDIPHTVTREFTFTYKH